MPGPMDLLNLSGQYTFGESNRISRFKISGGVTLDLVSVTDSGEFKHYTRMSGQGYPECHLKDWPMTSPGARY
jgi:hypothetical protein